MPSVAVLLIVNRQSNIIAECSGRFSNVKHQLYMSISKGRRSYMCQVDQFLQMIVHEEIVIDIMAMNSFEASKLA